MATIAMLVQQGALQRYDAVLGPRELETRRFFASSRLVKWFSEELSELGSAWNIEVTPAEQLDKLLRDYVVGKVLTYKFNFYPLTPHGSSVWELKTADLRVFGWFHTIDCFIGVVANTAQKVKDHNLYNGHLNEVIHFRQNLDLDHPKSIEGKEPKNVVSNFAYPDAPSSRSFRR